MGKDPKVGGSGVENNKSPNANAPQVSDLPNVVLAFMAMYDLPDVVLTFMAVSDLPNVVLAFMVMYQVTKMSGRGRERGRESGQNDLLAQIAVVLMNMNENLQHLNQNVTPSPNPHPLLPQGSVEYRGLDEFCRRNPPQFEVGFAPGAAYEWIQGLERISRAMGCSDAQKVTFASYVLVKDAENWWEYARRQLESEGRAITWEFFKERFLHKYFTADLKRKKDVEFLQLEQGDLSVEEYAAKFEELARYCPYYELEVDGWSKCTKFESGLKPKLKEILDFPTLVNKYRMYEDDLRAEELVASRTNPPRNVEPQRSHTMDKGKGMMFGDNRKPYASPPGYRGHLSQGSRNPTNAGGPQQDSHPLCNKCGRSHMENICPIAGNGCFHCKELRHMKRFCPKLDQRVNNVNVGRPRNTGRVFTMSGAEASDVEGMIKGNCMVTDIPLLVLFDSGATHSFISIDCVEKLRLPNELLPFDLVVSTPTSASVVVSTCASQCLVEVNGRMFTVDLIYLPLS
ncbi:hypothetical protein Lal_00014135 [Lupinus albus]|nr:hypothetical protein Lal_00014135 [Lupinus albus]